MSEGVRLARPRDDRMIAGVCAGLARHFGWSALHVRIGYVLLSALSAGFPGIGLYLVLWFLMPEAPSGPRTFRVREPDRDTDG
jgi:phage shock protein C